MNEATLEKVYDLISQVSLALRMNNAYSSEGRSNIAEDKKWLSDASSHLELAIQAIDNPHNTNALLDQVILSFSEYLNPRKPKKPLAMDSFQRWQIDIKEAILIFKSIKIQEKK